MLLCAMSYFLRFLALIFQSFNDLGDFCVKNRWRVKKNV